MLTAVNLNVNLNVERLPELWPISDNFSAFFILLISRVAWAIHG